MPRPKIQWTQTAFESLAGIKGLLARQSTPARAARWMESVFAAANQLVEYPHLGVEVDGDASLRELALGEHHLVYRLDGANITILSVRSRVPAPEGGDEFPNS